MKILVTGATGLIGKVIIRKALKKGYKVNFLTSEKSKINSIPGGEGYYWKPIKGIIDLNAFKGVTHLINLAGESISGRWTSRYKNQIIESRVLSANLISNALIDLQINLKGIISASAIGYYSDSNKLFNESDLCVPETFLQKVVEKWENSISELEIYTQNLSIVRIGLVISDMGGILSKITPPIKFCLGSAFGSGKQWQSWIHIDDICEIFLHIIENNIKGVINGVAPNPITQNELIKYLADFLDKPLIFPNVPKLLIKLLLSERSELLLSSHKVSSKKIERTGYKFRYPLFKNAIDNFKVK